MTFYTYGLLKLLEDVPLKHDSVVYNIIGLLVFQSTNVGVSVQVDKVRAVYIRLSVNNTLCLP